MTMYFIIIDGVSLCDALNCVNNLQYVVKYAVFTAALVSVMHRYAISISCRFICILQNSDMLIYTRLQGVILCAAARSKCGSREPCGMFTEISV